MNHSASYESCLHATSTVTRHSTVRCLPKTNRSIVVKENESCHEVDLFYVHPIELTRVATIQDTEISLCITGQLYLAQFKLFSVVDTYNVH